MVYRASYPHPATGNELFEIQSRARALDNNMYVVAPNMGTYYLDSSSTTPIDTFGGRSFIIDYRGQIVGKQEYGGASTYVAGIINIEELRYYRVMPSGAIGSKICAANCINCSMTNRFIQRTFISIGCHSNIRSTAG